MAQLHFLILADGQDKLADTGQAMTLKSRRSDSYGSFAAIPLPDGERKGPIAKQWEGEGRRSFRSFLN